jgi:hypothetical protein
MVELHRGRVEAKTTISTWLLLDLVHPLPTLLLQHLLVSNQSTSMLMVVLAHVL